MRQQTQCERNIVPLPFVLGPGKPWCQLAGKLFGMLVLSTKVSTPIPAPKSFCVEHTFSINPAKNLTILLKLSSSNP